MHLYEEGIELTISYYQHMGNQFVMDVEIGNQTDSVVRIALTQCSYKALKYINTHHP